MGGLAGHPRKFEFVERQHAPEINEEPGLLAFLQDPFLRGDATAEEIEFLEKLKFTRRPTAALLLPGAAKPARPAPFLRNPDVASRDGS